MMVEEMHGLEIPIWAGSIIVMTTPIYLQEHYEGMEVAEYLNKTDGVYSLQSD